VIAALLAEERIGIHVRRSFVRLGIEPLHILLEQDPDLSFQPCLPDFEAELRSVALRHQGGVHRNGQSRSVEARADAGADRNGRNRYSGFCYLAK
jgi:hypothetical protein